MVDNQFLRVASTGITPGPEDDGTNGGAIAAGVIVPLLVIGAAVAGVIIFIWYYRLVHTQYSVLYSKTLRIAFYAFHSYLKI